MIMTTTTNSDGGSDIQSAQVGNYEHTNTF